MQDESAVETLCCSTLQAFYGRTQESWYGRAHCNLGGHHRSNLRKDFEECKTLIEALLLMEKPARKGLSSVGCMPAADLERLLDV